MVQQSFHDRIARIQQHSGEVQMLSGPADVDAVRKQMRRKETAPNKPGPVKIMMTGMLMVPVGMAIGLMTKLFLDPDITPEAVNYLPLLAFVAAAHLALLGGVAGALASGFRKPTLNYALMFVFAGYGVASAVLGAAIQ